MNYAGQVGGLNWVRNLARRSAGISLQAVVRPPYQPFFMPLAPSTPVRRLKPPMAPTSPTDSVSGRSSGVQLESPASTIRAEQPTAADMDLPSRPPAEKSRLVSPPVSVEPVIEAGLAPTGLSPSAVLVEPAVRTEEPGVTAPKHEPAVSTASPLAAGPSETAPYESSLAPARAEPPVPAVSENVPVIGTGEVVPAQTEDRSPTPATESTMPTVKVEPDLIQRDQAPAVVPAERASPEGETPVSPTLVGVEPSAPSAEAQSAESAVPSTVKDSSATLPLLVRPAPPVQPPDITLVEPTDRPAVQVHIGTVEVRASRPPATSIPRPAPRPQGFERYLHLRGGEMEGLL